MPVTQAQIDRINQLARKSKAEGLTAEEKEEQAKLRRLYIDAMKESLRGQSCRNPMGWPPCGRSGTKGTRWGTGTFWVR